MSDPTRTRLARVASRMVRVNEEFRQQVSFSNAAGTRPILIALVTDTVGEVFGRMDKHHPEGANVLVGDSRAFTILKVERSEKSSEGSFVDVDVHADSPMGLFLAFAFLHREEGFRAKVVGQYSAKLQADRSVLTPSP